MVLSRWFGVLCVAGCASAGEHQKASEALARELGQVIAAGLVRQDPELPLKLQRRQQLQSLVEAVERKYRVGAPPPESSVQSEEQSTAPR